MPSLSLCTYFLQWTVFLSRFLSALGKMRASINAYDYYVDFPKVYANVDAIKIELNIMNSLIGA